MLFSYAHELWVASCCTANTWPGSPASWVGTCPLMQGSPSGPCDKPGLVSQKGWCCPELYNHFEQSREGGNQLLLCLAKRTGTSMRAVPFLPLQTGHQIRVQHSALCPLAEPAARLSTLQKQNFTHTISLSMDFWRDIFFYIFWPSVRSMPRPLSSNNIWGCSMRRARIQTPKKEISPCKTEMVMTIYSHAVILRKFPLIGANTDNIHRHQSKNNTFDPDSCTLKGQEGKIY